MLRLEYISLDNCSLTDDAWDDEEIIAQTIGLQCEVESGSEDESNVKEDRISFKEGETILNRAMLFLEQQGDNFNVNPNDLLRMRYYIKRSSFERNMAKKQTKIQDYIPDMNRL